MQKAIPMPTPEEMMERKCDAITKENEKLRDTIQKMRAGLPLSYVKTKCKHDGSWTTFDGKTCMACNNAALTERVRVLEEALREAVEAIFELCDLSSVTETSTLPHTRRALRLFETLLAPTSETEEGA